ncbi:hypothetical protein M0805_000080 [Coniferiporia weirii]|nr:hypothetical protein M0805_000080 [Coniferiporia weirii]
MAQKMLIDSAIQANKDHQYALRVYTERLEAELKTVDKLISAIDSDDELDDFPEMGAVSIEGAVKPVSVVLPSLLQSEESPFHEDAQWKRQYDNFTTVNQMKSREHDALREAIRIENQRMYALNDQSRGQETLSEMQKLPPEHFEQNKEGIDWKRVSVKMNAAIPSGAKRAPKECEIRWLGHLHPSFNHGPWTSDETDRLRAILEEDNEDEHVDWAEVAKKLDTNRTPIDCMRHGITRRTHVWSPEADLKLLEAIELYGQNNWQLVAMNVSEDATAHQCQKRYFDTLDPSLKSGAWAPDEDEKLLRAVAAFAGTSVSSVSDRAGQDGTQPSTKLTIPWQEVALFVPGRNNNQCRERYQDRLAKAKSRAKVDKGKGKAKVKTKAKPADTPPSSEETDPEPEPVPIAPAKRQAKPRPAYKGKGKVKSKVRPAKKAAN